MITVEVRVYASLQKYYPDLEIGKPLVIALDDKAKLGNLLGELKIPRDEIAVVMVNGRQEKESYLLQDGDRVGIFSPIGGG